MIDLAKAGFYAMDVYRWLSADDAVEEYAQWVRDYFEYADDMLRSPMRRSEALLTLGVVAARRSELDAEVAHGLTGLGDPRKSAPSLLCTVADFDGHRAEPITGVWREALGDVRHRWRWMADGAPHSPHRRRAGTGAWR